MVALHAPRAANSATPTETDLTAIALETFTDAPDAVAHRLQRKRLLTALSVAILAHVVALVVLAQPARFKLGIDRADPVITRWIELPATPSPGVAREEPSSEKQAQPKAEAPAKPKELPERTRPTPRPARSDDQSSATAAAAPTDPASAAAASSPLPEGQDPLRMLPTTPESFQMLDQLSRNVDADPAMFRPGNAVSVTIELNGQPKVWRFVIAGEDSILALSGREVPTLHLIHYPENDQDEQLEVWLVPQLAHRPIQLATTPRGALTSYYTNARVALNQLDQAARVGNPAAAGASAPAKPASQ